MRRRTALAQPWRTRIEARCLIAAALLGLGFAVARAQEPGSRAPIIDVHVHAMPIPPQGPRPINCGSPLQEFAPRDGKAAFTIDEVRSRCDRVLVAPPNDAANEAAVLGYLRQYNMTATVLGSIETVQLWHAALPERVIRGAGLPLPGFPSVEALRAAITAGKIALISEVAVQYEGIAPDASSMERYFSLAEELDVPIGIHIGLGAPAAAYVGQSDYLASLTHPMLLEPVLRRHPRLRIYVMHAGWPMGDEMVHVLYSHPQVYVDTGIIDWGIPRKEFYRYLQRLVEAGFGNRIMFGTDNMMWPEAIPIAIESIESAPFLSEQQKRDILYNNAARFLRIKKSATQ